MKIKELALIIAICIPFCATFGQKVKVKKEVLSIDKVDVGYFVEKDIYQRQKELAILDMQRDTVFKVGSEVIFSVLDGEDEIYKHSIFAVPSKNIRINYPIGDGYYFNAKSIIRHFMEIGLIDAQLTLNEAKVDELVKQNVVLPEEIATALKKEKEEMNNVDYISEKIADGRISLKKIGTTSETLKYLYRANKYYFDTYEVSSVKDEEKLAIGKVVIRYPLKSTTLDELGSKGAPTIAGDLSKGIIFAYNSKGGRVARLGEAPFGEVKIYNGNIVMKRTEHKLFEEKTIVQRANKLVDYLISENKL